jgi:exo-beta-1,3-glucanase (GH17 family)
MLKIASLFVLSLLVPATAFAGEAVDKQSPFIKRPFVAERDGKWIGNAICYGPHRDGQAPGAESPTREQLLEDLHIMLGHWNMLRMYGSRGATEEVLSLIKEHGLDMKVVVGAWIGPEAILDEQGNVAEAIPEEIAANQAEVDTAIRLANEYPDIVVAVTIGNETQVEWSAHKTRPAVLIKYIRQARAQTEAPVSTADVGTYWAKPHSKEVADELDFVVTHVYAMWNGQQLETAMDWTKHLYAENLANHPDHQFVIGEAGWATQMKKDADEGQWIKGEANEANQVVFHRDFIAWATENQVPNFFFEAFDENWKGGDHPDMVEKHWGVFNADRTPKKVLTNP